MFRSAIFLVHTGTINTSYSKSWATHCSCTFHWCWSLLSQFLQRYKCTVQLGLKAIRRLAGNRERKSKPFCNCRSLWYHLWLVTFHSQVRRLPKFWVNLLFGIFFVQLMNSGPHKISRIRDTTNLLITISVWFNISLFVYRNVWIQYCIISDLRRWGSTPVVFSWN